MTGALPRPRRRRIRYELLSCALHDHVLLGTDAAAVRPEDDPVVRETGGLRWHRCLRCDSWVPRPAPDQPTRPHPPGRDEVQPPLRGRPLRDRYVLRLIALDRVLHVVVLMALAALLLAFAAHRNAWQHQVLRVLRDLQGGVGGPVGSGHGLVYDLRRLVQISNRHLYETAAVVFAYAILEAVEAVGLWYARRWAEYLTFVATTALVPLEIYELTRRATALKSITLVVNLAIVGYLLVAKRLFGVRGGGSAERAEREHDTGWAAIERATPGPVGTDG